MAIAKEDIAQVRESVDIVAVIGEQVALRKVGLRWTGLCPFHVENTPSFSVNATEGFYYCFGCQEKGDVISFVQATQGLDFVGAVEQLAARVGIELHYDSRAVQQEQSVRKQLLEIMERAVAWYHERLLSSPDAGAARAYLRSRGFDGEIVRKFQLGWAPDGWDSLAKSLNIADEQLKATGLGFVNRHGSQQDAFRSRVLFPIFDTRGKPIAFGGRILPDSSSDQPKYKNSPESTLYTKSKTLYALNWAKEDIARVNQIIICEGYTDVMAFFSAGIPRAVATCGTALTEEHVKLMKQFASQIVLAYDADGAGQAAAERMYAWEKKYDLAITVATFPKGFDPAEAARQDPLLLQRSLEGAKPFLRFRLDRLYERSDFRTIESRARTAQHAIEMIREHPNTIVRDQYVFDIASRARIPVEQLQAQLRGKPILNSQSSQPQSSQPQSAQHVLPRSAPRNNTRRASQNGALRIEREALRVAIHHPDQVQQFLDDVIPASFELLVEDLLFQHEVSRAAFAALLNADTIHEATTLAGPEAGELLSHLVMEPSALEDENDATAPYVRLIARAVETVLAQLALELVANADQFAEIVRDIEWLRLRSEELREASSCRQAARQIFEWFSQSTRTRSGAAETDGSDKPAGERAGVVEDEAHTGSKESAMLQPSANSDEQEGDPYSSIDADLRETAHDSSEHP